DQAAMSVATTSALRISADRSAGQRGSDFAELSRQVKQDGLLKRRGGYYARKIAANVGLFGLGVAVFVILGDSWWQLGAGLFFALLCFEALMLRVSSVQAVLRREVKHLTLEAILLSGQTVCYLTAVLLVLSPLKAVLFITVQQALMGVYLGCSFAPNHKGMPVLAKGEQLDYLRKQVLTSRNVRGGRWVDFLLGGLNYQIEHHLFPSMPRPNLRHAQ